MAVLDSKKCREHLNKWLEADLKAASAQTSIECAHIELDVIHKSIEYWSGKLAEAEEREKNAAGSDRSAYTCTSGEYQRMADEWSNLGTHAHAEGLNQKVVGTRSNMYTTYTSASGDGCASHGQSYA